MADNILLAPIIDSSATGLVKNHSEAITFYWNNSEDSGVNKDYAWVWAESSGNSALTDTGKKYVAIQIDNQASTSSASIEIPFNESIGPNQAIQLKIGISKDSFPGSAENVFYYSAEAPTNVIWSDITIFYLLDPSSLMVWGGLTKKETLSPLISLDDELLLKEGTNSYLQRDSSYYIKGTLKYNTDDSLDNDSLYWYRIIVKTNDDKIDSGKQFIDYLWDQNRKSFIWEYPYPISESCVIQIIYKTRKGYLGTYSCQIEYEETQIEELSDGLGLIITPMDSIGINKISLSESGQDYIKPEEGEEQQAFDYILYRKPATSSFWEKFYEKTSAEAYPYFEDLTIEPGVLYEYKAHVSKAGEMNFVAFFPQEGGVINCPEDILLCTQNTVLKIKYNPEISSYKYNIGEAVTPTLGAVYPFVRRNGLQKYRTFSLGGLISYHSQEELGDNIVGDSQEGKTHVIKETVLNTDFCPEKYREYISNWGQAKKEQLLEKLFRDRVVEFLCEDQVLLFKTMTEGNLFIRLTGISLTPNKTLGRAIYSFSATATEVAPATIETYLKYFKSPGLDSENLDALSSYSLTAKSYSEDNSSAEILEETTEGEDENITLKLQNSVELY